ncbi:MAG: antitoxin-like protein [Ignavibacteria bacterium]|nr:antitoxin-like protein [Ignavibacteria bacterium]
MIYYTKDELKSSTAITRNFGSLLDNLRTKKLEKIAVIRNNKMEAVILPIEDYEKLKEKEEFEEHTGIYNLIKVREQEPIEHGISFDSVLNEYGIRENEL